MTLNNNTNNGEYMIYTFGRFFLIIHTEIYRVSQILLSTPCTRCFQKYLNKTLTLLLVAYTPFKNIF